MRRRLTDIERVELKRLFQYEGWHIVHLARYFNVHHSTVQQYTDTLERHTPPLEYCPPELEELSAYYNRRINQPQLRYTYEEYLEQEEKRRMRMREACPHHHIAIICIKCGTHFEETKNQPARAKLTFI